MKRICVSLLVLFLTNVAVAGKQNMVLSQFENQEISVDPKINLKGMRANLQCIWEKNFVKAMSGLLLSTLVGAGSYNQMIKTESIDVKAVKTAMGFKISTDQGLFINERRMVAKDKYCFVVLKIITGLGSYAVGKNVSDNHVFIKVGRTEESITETMLGVFKNKTLTVKTKYSRGKEILDHYFFK